MNEISQFDGSYSGSTIFNPLADRFGLSVDLVNFMITQSLALLLASVFRSYLHPSRVSASVRHAYGLVIGLCFGYFCFGTQAVHIAGLPAVCYIVIRTTNPQIVQRTVLVVALAYLSCVHLHRQYYDSGAYSLDITGPLMIITQKVTSLAFSIHDGFARETKELTKSQQYHVLQKVPSPLEFFSYVFHFQGIMAGPFVFYRDYIEFIEGQHFLKRANVNGNIESSKQIVHEPSPTKAVIKKVIGSILCAYIYIKLITVYPLKNMQADDAFIEDTNFVYKSWYIMSATTAARFKYYFAWMLADAICNNSGLGFNGYDVDGSPKWDLISNIYVIPFELGTSFRDCINNWNIGTNSWLRSVVYERVPKNYGTILTFSLSAVWHGFYPGYYLTFASGALFVMAARKSRRCFRHLFQQSEFTRTSYDVLTCLVTRLFMGYTTFPFVILGLHASLRLYLKLFMCLHLVALATIFILPKIMRGEKRAQPVVAAASTRPLTTNKHNNHTATHHTSNRKDLIATNLNEDGQEVNREIDDGNNNSCSSSSSSDDIVDSKQTTSDTKYLLKDLINNQRIKEESDNLQALIKGKIEHETRNIGDIFDKTVNGFVELKEDLLRLGDNNEFYANTPGLRKRKEENASSDKFLKKEIDAINAAVQQANNVLPAVLSNGHAK